jgi:hypothetical protein
MSVEDKTTTAVDTTTQTAEVTAEKTAAVTTEEADLLGDVPAAETTEAPAADAPAEDDVDDLLEGKVSDAEETVDATPEDYQFTAPEGFELDTELADAFKPVAKELKLSQDQAQGLVEKFAPKLLAQIGERQAAQWKVVQHGWAKEAKSDPAIYDAASKSVRPEIAIARDYFGPEFTAVIKMLGGSNHPVVLKGLAKLGQGLGEDTPAFGQPSKATTTKEQRLYPNDQPNK